MLLCTDTIWDSDDRLAPLVDEAVVLRPDVEIDAASIERITVAFFSHDAWPRRAGPFFKVVMQAPNLRWLHTFSAGVDSPVFVDFMRRGVRVTSSSGASSQPIAQTVALMLLALTRRLPEHLDAQRRHVWQQLGGTEIAGTNLAVIGLGPIGLETARLGQAFGMHVRGCRRTVSGDEPCPTVTFAELDGLLEWADHVVLALPLTPQTHGLLDADRIVRMRPGATLINVGRGDLVDEAALIDALQRGHIGRAGLDVFATEPLPADSPLWDMPNVIVTPHDSGVTDGTAGRATDQFAANLARYVRCEPLHNEATPPST